MYNIRDWCISRQLWWGHRIPAWHCQRCGQVTVAREDADECCALRLGQPRAGSGRARHLVQLRAVAVLHAWLAGSDRRSGDVLPDFAADHRLRHPVLLGGAHDHARHGVHGRRAVPQVYIHGLVRDAERQKMSKTKGNVIDPLVVTEKYGTDAVRMALLQGAAPGTDIAIGEERMESARAFANKIWNAARLIFMNMESSAVEPWVASGAELLPSGTASPKVLTFRIEDRWIFSRLNRCAEPVNRAIENVSLSRSRADIVALLLARVLRLVSGTEEAALRRELRPERALAQSADGLRDAAASAAPGDAVPHRGAMAAPDRAE